MKRVASACTLLVVALLGIGSANSLYAAPPAPPTFEGTWDGAITVRGRRRDLTVAFGPGGTSPAGMVTVPDEYALDEPLRNVKLDASAVHFELPDEMQKGIFDGKLEPARITGSFTGEQNGDPLSGTFELERRPPAHPGYRSEEIAFRGGEGRLAGTLFLPPGSGPHPAIVFYHGSGPQTRDSYLRHFAAGFARVGIAALIYDKRGCGASEGTDWRRSSATFEDLVNDGLAGVGLLKQRHDIDPACIGVWGLSQGAWLGPMAAAHSTDVAFVVALSGGGVSPASQELYDDEVKLRALGYSAAQVADALAVLQVGDAFIRDGSDANWERVQASLASAKEQAWFRYLDKFPLVLPRQAWWHGKELDYDPRETLRKVRVPVLAILGEVDMSTPTEETARRIRDALLEGGNADVTVTVVPRADHAMQVGPDPWLRLRVAGEGGSPPPSNAVPEWDWMRPSPGWEEAMTAWVEARTRARQASTVSNP